MQIPYKQLAKISKQYVPNPIFLSISGSHLFGFDSPDSDYDVRGCHIAPLKEIISLHQPKQTIEFVKVIEELDMDIVSHEVGKFLKLLIAPNGNCIEQIYSPHIIITTKYHKTLMQLTQGCICKKLEAHYRGMATQNYKKYVAKERATAKKYLYVLRSLLAGIYAMQTGKIEPNINKLNQKFKYNLVDDLIREKTAEKKEINKNPEAIKLILKLFNELEDAKKNSNLPDVPTNIDKINDFLVKLRLNK